MDLRGTLTSERLREVFQKLARNKAIGTLTVTCQGKTKYIYFARAGVRLLSSGQRRLRLGDILVARGSITADQLQAILQRQEETGEMIGKILADWGLVTEEDIDGAVKSQIEEEIYDLFTLEDASFEFTEGAPPPELFDPDQRATRLTFDVDALVGEAARRAAELEEMRQLVPGDRTVFERTGATDLAFSEHDEAAASKTVVDLVDGARSVGELCEQSALSRFDTYRALAGLVVAGRIAPAGEDGRGGESREQRETREAEVAGTIEACEAALLTQPGDPTLRMRLAEAYAAQGESEPALLHWNLAAKSALKSGGLDQALAATQQALAIDPENLEANERLLRVYVERRESEGALTHAERLAGVYADAGQRDKLRDMYRLLSHVVPDDMDVRKKLVNVYLDLKDVDGALGEYEAMAKIALKQRDQRTLEEIYVKATRLAPGRADVQKRFRGLGLGGAPGAAGLQAARGSWRRRFVRLVAVAALCGLGAWGAAQEIRAREDARPRWGAVQAAESAAAAAGPTGPADPDRKRRLERQQALLDAAVADAAEIERRWPFSLFTWLEVRPRLERLRRAAGEATQAVRQEAEHHYKRWADRRTRANAAWLNKDRATALPIYEEIRAALRGDPAFSQFVAEAEARLAMVAAETEEADALWQRAQREAAAGLVAPARATVAELRATYPGTAADRASRLPLRIRSIPSEAKLVAPDGTAIGTTPYDLWLTRAQEQAAAVVLEFTLHLDGYESRTVRLVAGDRGDVPPGGGEDGVFLARLRKRPLFVVDVGGVVESRPALRGDWCYGGSRNDRGEVWGLKLSAIDPRNPGTWNVAWRHDEPGTLTTAVLAPVAVDDDGLLYAVTTEGVLLVLDGQTDLFRGELLWRWQPPDRVQVRAAPVLAGDVVAVCTFRGAEGTCWGFRRGSRTGPELVFRLAVGATEFAPAAAGPWWLFACRGQALADPKGRVRAFSPADQRLVGEVWLDAKLSGSPAVEGNWCVVGDRKGKLHLLDISDDGQGRPRLALRDSRDCEAPIAASPVLADGAVYVATESGRLMAFRIQDGRLVPDPGWKHVSDVRHPIRVGPVLAQGTLVCGTIGDDQGGTVVAVNAYNGELQWEYRTGRSVSCLPRVRDGLLYVGADDGKLYVLSVR